MNSWNPVAKVVAELRLIVKELKKQNAIRFWSIVPDPFTISPVAERKTFTMNLLTYRVSLPAAPANTDIVRQSLAVSIDGADAGSVDLATNRDSAEIEVKQDATVSLRLTYVDDAGNVSATREQTFVARDTIAPDAPGEFGEICLVGERNVPDAKPVAESESEPQAEPQAEPSPETGVESAESSATTPTTESTPEPAIDPNVEESA